MLAQFLQLLFSGVAIGAIYAFAALGFTLIYNASTVINFAQGEFIMLGGMLAAWFIGSGMPLPVAVVLAILVPTVVGVVVEKVAIAPAKNAEVVTLIIITIGVSLVIRGFTQIGLGKSAHTFPAFSGNQPINLAGASLHPQSLWVLGVTVLVVVALWYFFSRTLGGKKILATSYNRAAAQLVGINTRWVMLCSYGMAAALGSLGGILVTPITMTSYDVGVMLGLKGFCAAIIGGMSSGFGTVLGGLLLGLLESFGAGLISSGYKDAIAFIILLLILFIRPQGLFSKAQSERV